MALLTNNFAVEKNCFDNFQSKFEKLNLSHSSISQADNLSNNLILAAISEAQGGEDLMSHLETVSLSAGEELYAADWDCNYVYFPETCVVSHLQNLADGDTIEIAMIGREGIIGACAVIGSLPVNPQALVTLGGKARRIKTALLRQAFLYNDKVRILLHDYLNAYITRISQKVMCQAFHLMENRFCSWLLMLRDRARENQFKLTQEQMSLLLGVNRPSLTVAAKKLRDEELIDYARGKVWILDAQKLKSKACECYPAIHSMY